MGDSTTLDHLLSVEATELVGDAGDLWRNDDAEVCSVCPLSEWPRSNALRRVVGGIELLASLLAQTYTR